jgi:hydroxyacylglutathione hydrolase
MSATRPKQVRSLTPTCWISQSRVFATNSLLLFSGGESVLVDPGITPGELTAIRDFVAVRGSAVRALVLTHAHWDHLLGPAWFPDVPVVAHRAYTTVLDSHAHHLVQLVARWQHEEGLEAGMPFVPPEPAYSFEQQMTLFFGDHCVHLIAAPGHAPDHCALYEPESGLLFAGDMLSDLEVPMVMDSLSAYRQTLLRLAALEVRVLVPGHGTPTADAVEITQRFAQDLAYLETLGACVTEAVARGASIAETVAACEPVSFAQPDEYPNAHRWNIEQAYLEAGGHVDKDAGPSGWEQDWL